MLNRMWPCSPPGQANSWIMHKSALNKIAKHQLSIFLVPTITAKFFHLPFLETAVNANKFD